MTDKYIQMTEDLQYNKRELQNWKQKQLLTQQELDTLKIENKDLKNIIDRLQETNSKLVQNNRQLSEEKDSIATDYSEEMISIKDEIAKKQQQIIELRQITSPAVINQDLATRHLRFQLNDQFERQTAVKDRKIEELTLLNQKLSYEKLIEKEKLQLKVEALESQIKDMKNKHQNQIQEYSNKLFQLGQARPSEDREILRKAKKQNEELKKRLDLATSELSTVLQEKNQVHNDYRKWMKEHQKQFSEYQEELLTYKSQIARLNELAERNSSKRDEFVIKERERDIKKLKGELEEARDEVLGKDKKISDLEVEKVKLQSQIKLLKNDQEKVINRVEENDKYEIERLQKELREARLALEKMRGQNFQLSDRIHEVNRNAFDNKVKFDDFKEQQVRDRLKRQVSEEIFKSKERVIQESRVEPVFQNEEEAKKLQEALRGQKGKLRDFLAKYIDLKKKYEILEGKLRKANQKIVELLRDKIVLGSPKATSKHFQFPTEPQTKISPQKSNQKSHLNIKIPKHPNNSEDNVINSLTDQKFMTTAQFKHYNPDPHSRTNPVFNRQFMSPQDNRHIRIEDESLEQNEHSYYEKSLKMKNQRFRELKCTNHSNEKSIKE